MLTDIKTSTTPNNSDHTYPSCLKVLRKDSPTHIDAAMEALKKELAKDLAKSVCKTKRLNKPRVS